MSKRTIDSFFAPAVKKPRVAIEDEPQGEKDVDEKVLKVPKHEDIEQSPDDQLSAKQNDFANSSLFTNFPTYPFPIRELPSSTSLKLKSLSSSTGKPMNNQPDLDLLYFQPFIPKSLEHHLFKFLREELPFYRVEYDITRGGISTHVKTPRYTTVFGLDDSSCFDFGGKVVDIASQKIVQKDTHYLKYPPRPIPKCLNNLRVCTEAATGCQFNFCLVNYYASGSDSISYHSDDERFLGPEPAIASFSLGSRRDFLLKHKPVPPDNSKPQTLEAKPLKFPLASGDMILMRGKTQANWLHSIPKRTGKNADDGGRINITFRRALIKAGTENYYNYNVGTGPVFRWNKTIGGMEIWKPVRE